MERIIIDGLSFSLPLFIMAVGGIYSEKSGITNLALEGFQGMGAFTGALAVVLMMNLGIGNASSQFYAAIFFAILGGALYSLLHALLCIRMKANQVISGVVLNILAMSLDYFDCFRLLVHLVPNALRHESPCLRRQPACGGCCRRKCFQDQDDCGHVFRCLVGTCRNLLCLFHFRKLFFQYFCRLRVFIHCGHDFW